MKKLTLFSIRSFAGPFVVTFFISMFMLIMQFTWKYIDDLLGKGLEASVIIELMFYVSASLIPLALPLAILLSSIMTFGNLAESNELTALKSSGMSLLRIMRPLTIVVFLLASFTFLFYNYVIPVATFKWHGLIYDIQETKVSMLLKPGAYSKGIEGYAIKVKNIKDNKCTDITIHDYSEATTVKTIKAKSGEIFKSKKGDVLFFRLLNGKVNEELKAEPPIFTSAGNLFKNQGEYRPQRRTEFDLAIYKMNLSGFKLNRTDEDLFKDEYDMLNVFQLAHAKDSLQQVLYDQSKLFVDNRKNEKPMFLSFRYKVPVNQAIKNPIDSTKVRPDLWEALKKQMQVQENTSIPPKILTVDSFSLDERRAALSLAASNLRNQNNSLNAQKDFIQNVQRSVDLFNIEVNKKIALPVAIIVLFFIGAPLGAIVRKGGFGAPVVIAALLFMIYFVLFSLGENLAENGSVSPFIGMWMPTLVLAPFALFLTIAASNDLGFFDKKLWKLILSFGRKR